MADKPAKDKKDGDEAANESEKKKGLPIKTILVVLVLLVVEAVAVVAVVSMGGPPAAVKGGELEITPADEMEATSEVLILHDKFPNHSTGRVWLWDIEVQVQVKQKNREHIENVLEERKAEIQTGISQIVRNAHQNQLNEPNLETMSRQLAQYLRDVFGEDGDGDSRIVKVLLPKFVGFPADF